MSSPEFASASLTVGQLNAFVKKVGGAKTVIGVLNGTVEFQINEASKPLLLQHIGTVDVPAGTEPFIVDDHFKVDTSPKAPVNISFIGYNFRNYFGGMAEEPESYATLCYYKLTRQEVDGPIIAELGGEENPRTTLRHIYHLMTLQKNGEAGVLLNNGRANIFYAHDRNGVLRAVYVFWDGDGWLVRADPVEYPGRWDAGLMVFSRSNSVLGPSATVSAAS